MFKNKFILILILASVILPFLSYLLNFYTDWLFFVETGFSSVFTTTLYAKTGAGLFFGGLLFVFVHDQSVIMRTGRNFPLSGIFYRGRRQPPDKPG